jgi:hypothetical protein
MKARSNKQNLNKNIFLLNYVDQNFLSVFGSIILAGVLLKLDG